MKLKSEYFHKKLLLDSRKQTIYSKRLALQGYSCKQSPQALKIIIPEILDLLKELESTLSLQDIHIASNLFKRLDRLIARNFQHNTVVFTKTLEVLGLYLEQEDLLKKSSALFAYSANASRKNLLGVILSIIGHFVIDSKEMKNHILSSHVHTLIKLRLLQEDNRDVLNHNLWILCAFIEDDSKYIRVYNLEEYYSLFHHLFYQLQAAFPDSGSDIDVKSLKRGSKIVESLIDPTDPDANEEAYVDLVHDNINEMLMAILRLMDNSKTVSPILFDRNFIDLLIDFFRRTQGSLRLCNAFIQVLSSYMSSVEHPEIIEYLMITQGCLSILCQKLMNSNVQNFIKEKILFTIGNSIVSSEKVAVAFMDYPGLSKQLEEFIFIFDNDRLTSEVIWCLGTLSNFTYTETYEAFLKHGFDKLVLNSLPKISKSTDIVSLCVLLDALKNLLQIDQQHEGQVSENIKNGEIIDLLAELQTHKRHKVYDKAYDILTEYFEDMI